MKNILVALDYAPSAQQVAEAGFATGMAMNAAITLLHITEDPVYYASTIYSPIMGFGGFTNLDFLQPDILAEIKKAAVTFLEKTRAHLGGNDISILIKEGNAAESILEAAKALDAGMIVMGAKSRSWLEDALLGSVTKKVLHHTQVPLLIIPVKNAAGAS